MAVGSTNLLIELRPDEDLLVALYLLCLLRRSGFRTKVALLHMHMSISNQGLTHCLLTLTGVHSAPRALDRVNLPGKLQAYAKMAPKLLGSLYGKHGAAFKSSHLLA